MRDQSCCARIARVCFRHLPISGSAGAISAPTLLLFSFAASARVLCSTRRAAQIDNRLSLLVSRKQALGLLRLLRQPLAGVARDLE